MAEAGGPDVELEIGGSIDPAVLADLTRVIVKAFEQGLKGGFNAKNILSGPALGQLKKLESGLTASSTSFRKAGVAAQKFGGDLTGVQRNIVKFAQVTRDTVKDSEKVIASSLYRDGIAYQRASIERRSIAERSSNEIRAIQIAEGKIAAVEAQVTGQRVNTAARQAGQQRLQITRAVLDNIARLEKGLGATIAGIARTATSAVSRAFSGAGGIAKTLTHSNSQFTSGLSSSLTQRESILRSSFSRQERSIRSSVTRQEAELSRLRRITSTGVAGAATGRGIGGGIAAGAGGAIGITALLTSGFKRFSDLERINKQFLALTGNIEDTNLLLDEVKQFAKKTPFDLVGVADLAKGFLAIGTNAKDVLPQVSAIADAVALTGGGTEELTRIQRAIGQVVSAGRLQGDELNQLSESLPGLNIRQILADQLTGGDTAALIKMQEAGEVSSDLFVNGLITGLQTDPRLVGAAEALAGTLSGRLANLKESFADFGASLIGLVAGPLKQLFSVLNEGLAAAATLIRGEGLSAALQTLRDALFGAAAGFGAILAAKGAIEVFQLLAATLPLIISPMGLLIAAAVGLGAAINVLRDDVPEIGKFFGGLKDAIAEIASGPLSIVRDFLGDVGDFFTAGETVASNFRGGVEQVVRTKSPFAVFVQTQVIPALKTAVDYVQDTVIPALKQVGDTVQNGFGVALDVIQRFAAKVLPVLRPAIDGLNQLRTALGLGGLVTIAAGLAGFAVGGPLVGAALAGIALVGTKLAGLFTGDLDSIGRGAGAAASGIGSVLGGVASTVKAKLAPVGAEIISFFAGLFSGPNLSKVASGFLGVVEQIGFILGNIVSDPRFVTAVAAVVAAAVIVGAKFVEGFGRGIIENIPELASLIGNAFLELIKVAFDPEVILKVVLAAFVFTKIVRPLIAQFKSLGSDAGKAFGTGLKGSISSARGFGSTLFGGAGKATGVTKALDKELLGINNRMRVLGSTTIFGRDQIQSARSSLAQLERSFTDAEKRGLQARDRLRSAWSVAGAIFGTGAGGILGGLGQIAGGFVNLGRTIASSIGAAARNATTALAQFLTAGGRNAQLFANEGRASGTKYGEGLVSSLRGGLSQMKASVVAAFATLKGEAKNQGTTVGAQFAQAALIAVGAFMGGKFEGQAGGSGVFSALTAGLTGIALGSPLLGAVGAGAALIGAHLGRSKKAADEARERIEALSDAIGSELTTAIDEGVISLGQLEAGLDIGDISGFDAVRNAFKEGLGGDAQKTLDRLGVTFNKTFLPALDNAVPKVEDLKNAIVSAAIAGGEFADSVTITDPTTVGREFFLDARDQAAAFFAFVNGQDLTLAQQLFIDSADAAPLRDALKEIGIIYDDTKSSIEGAAESQRIFNKDSSNKNSFESFRIGNEQAKHLLDTYEQIRQTAHDSAVAEQLARGTAELAKMTTEAERADAALDAALGDRNIDGLAETVNSAILSLQGSFEGLTISGDVFNNAKLAEEQGEFRDSFKETVRAGIDEGLIIDDATLNAITLPLLAAVLDGVTDTEIRTKLEAQFTEMKLLVSPEIKRGLVGSDLMPSDIPEIFIPVEYDTGKTEFSSQDKANLMNDARNLGQPIGASLIAGVVAGMRAGQIQVDRVAGEIIHSADEALRRAAVINSPSKLTALVGLGLSEGIAVGMESGRHVVTDEARHTVRATLAELKGLAQAEDGSFVPLNFWDSWITAEDGTKVPPSFWDNIAEDGTQVPAGFWDDMFDPQAAIDARDEMVREVYDLSNLPPPPKEFWEDMFGGFKGADEAGIAIGTGIATALGEALKQALEDGLDASEIDISGLVDGLLDEALGGVDETIGKVATAVREATTALFAGLTGADAKTGPFGTATGDVVGAKSDITSGIQGFLSTFDSNAQTIFEVNAKKLGDLSASEREIFGENLFSLNPEDVLGSSNLGALTEVFDNIAGLGEALLAQGKPAAEVAKILEGEVDKVVTLATNLGFNEEQVLALVDALGLSDQALAEFILGINDLNEAASKPITPPTDPAVDEDVRTSLLPRPGIFDPVLRASGGNRFDQTFVVNLPSGDPQANALAVANALAYAGSLP